MAMPKMKGTTTGALRDLGLNALGEMLGGKKPSGGSSGGSGGSNGASGRNTDYAAALNELTEEMYESTFMPDELRYEQKDAETLSGEIASWLRPVYDRMIASRQRDTARYGAELDADAYARGMGQSTFVTDVKRRQMQKEAEDISILETDYGAVLAKNLTEALNAQREAAMRVEMFNAERRDFAYGKAFEAAKLLLPYVGSTPAVSSGGGKSGGKGTAKGTASGSSGTTSAENIETYLAGLTKSERTDVFAGRGTSNAAIKNEIISSVGMAGYYTLWGKYS